MQNPATTHPAWCDRALCTAKPTPTTDEWTEQGAGAFGEHKAQTAIGQDSVTLAQQIAPWDTHTFVEVTNSVWGTSALPLDQLVRMLGLLGIGLVDTDALGEVIKFIDATINDVDDAHARHVLDKVDTQLRDLIVDHDEKVAAYAMGGAR